MAAATSNLGTAVDAVQNATNIQARQISAAQTAVAVLHRSVSTVQGVAAAIRATAEITHRNIENVLASLLEEEGRASDRDNALHRMFEAGSARVNNGLHSLSEQVATLMTSWEQRFAAAVTAMSEVHEQQCRLFASQGRTNESLNRSLFAMEKT
jgi:hypothetical protein